MGGRMKRHDWAARLYDVIEAHAERTFVWGSDDCCLFVARGIDAMRDSEIEAGLRDLYTDERSAMKLIASHGGLAGAVSAVLGEMQQVRAVRGDAVLIDGGDGDALGICLGPQVVAMGPSGLRMVPRSEIRGVWPQ